METPARLPAKVFSSSCATRVLFDQLADKWSMMILTVLHDGPHRFNAIMRRIEGITQKALTHCLRRLECNGMVERRVLPTSPVGVEYHLTPLGDSLLKPVRALYGWMLNHLDEVEAARVAYEARTAGVASGGPQSPEPQEA
ncbi:winged helix-turn-helix transcriptional regulator [Kerstersia gyiorum]|uniref:winged helix-turn-helix transcriptional regulator n=1 Tax=Kerstersia gyiorum TaxID=206506 RepID=UPI0030D60305